MRLVRDRQSHLQFVKSLNTELWSRFRDRSLSAHLLFLVEGLLALCACWRGRKFYGPAIEQARQRIGRRLNLKVVAQQSRRHPHIRHHGATLKTRVRNENPCQERTGL